MLAPPPHPRNLEASFRDLGSARPDVRASAIEDLSRHARADDDVKKRAIPLLEKRLADEHPRVRAAAAVAIGELQAMEVVPAVLLAADDDDAYVRQMALNALGELGDARALPRLRRATSDKRPEMRYQAVIALSRVAAADDDEIGQVLLAATKDDDDAVAHIALRVAEERLDAGKPADPRLVTRARALVASASPHLALVAAIFLGKAADEAGHALLMRVVRGEKIGGEAPEREDEQAAVELAGELGLVEATPHLERRAWGVMRFVKDTCSFHAKIALARMKHPRAIAEIMRDLESTRPDVLGAAVVAAGRARIAEARAILERLPTVAMDPELVREALARLERAANEQA
ncbi:MAG: HEAT repeat domain-containing protein [Labilithrix sp.]|nr:HEAT repeat domain-containing protein [Labilithrix sp.]